MTKSEEAQGSLYCSKGYTDQVLASEEITAGEWRNKVNLDNSAFETVAVTQCRNYTQDASLIRDNFVEYFTTVGSVSWQTERAGANEIYKK